MTLDPRESPTAFALSFAHDPWLTPARQSVIASAFAEWGAWLSEPLPAITSHEYAVYGSRSELLATAPQVPPDTYRVWVGVGPTLNPGAFAEGNPVGMAVWGIDPGRSPGRSPGGQVVINPAVTTDVTLPAVALHEAGHTFGLNHQRADTPPAYRDVMYPFLDPNHVHLSGMDARNWLWSNPSHTLPAGTVVMGVGTTPGGWFIYQSDGGMR